MSSDRAPKKKDPTGEAIAQNSEAFRLYDRGEHSAALSVLDTTIESLRIPASEQNPEGSAALAMSLVNRSNVLLALGVPVRAAQSAFEAVQLYDRLAERCGDLSVEARQLGALESLRDSCEAAGEIEQASDAAMRVVSARRGAGDSELERRKLVQALSALGRLQGRSTSWQDALLAFEEALDVLEDLAEATGREDSLERSNLLIDKATVLRGLGRTRESAEVLASALSISASLIESKSDAVAASRARALATRATSLAEEGFAADALRPASEAVVIFRALAERDPGEFEQDLAAALNNQATRLSENDFLDQALDAAQEAVDLRRRLTEREPESRAAELTASLTNLSNRLREAGRGADALSAANEAVLVGEAYASVGPQMRRPYVIALFSRGVLREGAGLRSQAFEDVERSAELALTILRDDRRALPDGGRRILEAYERLAAQTGRSPDQALVSGLGGAGQPGPSW